MNWVNECVKYRNYGNLMSLTPDKIAKSLMDIVVNI